jgi:hypothetical protein
MNTITDLFSVTKNDKKEYPLNVKFKYLGNTEIDQRGKGPGVYVISYNDKIIYIGQHLSKQNKAKNDDGFFKERCLKHLQTFTSRSHVLKLGKSQAKIKWFAQNAEIENGFYEHINSAGIGDNHFKDGAPLTSKNRIRFSKEHWNDFKNENDVTNILNGFKIWWFKIGPFTDDEYEHAKGIVKHIEAQLICRYLPECNSEFYKVIPSYEIRCIKATTDSLIEEINKLIDEVAPDEKKSIGTEDSFIIYPNKNP